MLAKRPQQISSGKLGIVFDIQRFSIHDGPGIRTLIFLKGCPLRCLWCSNPEGQCREPSLMFIERLCIGCKRCVEVCLEGAVTVSDGQVKWDKEKCKECMKCIAVCPSMARQVCGKQFTVKQLLDEVERDRAYYWRSGGGVTVGGGEPLVQPEFTRGFLKEAKKSNLHTAVETCGYGEWKQLESIMEYVDLLFIDIKHMNPEKHKELTGISNELILENIRKASLLIDGGEKTIIIRVPVVSGCTDSEDNIKAIAEFVQKVGNIKKIELLPYHGMGAIKYDRIKWTKTYQLQGLRPPSDDHMQRLREIVESYGLKGQIGG